MNFLPRQIISEQSLGSGKLMLLGESESLSLGLFYDAPGVVRFAGSPKAVLLLHFGLPAYISSRRAGQSHRGQATHRDIDVIPPGTPSLCEVDRLHTSLTVGVNAELLRHIADELVGGDRPVEIRNRFQVRDPQIENMVWSLKTEMENGYPCGRLYLDGLAIALAAKMVRCHSSHPPCDGNVKGGMPSWRLKRVLSFIEENLGCDLNLRELASVAGLSVTHFKILFRKTLGVPAHQYVIRRRVERAASLLRESEMPIGQVALESGFSHQSHLALHMRRLLGVSPSRFRNELA
jgi:AraC family transcriptional regulator